MNRVLVLCTGNSARSLIAEALLREQPDLEVHSAGIEPKGINPLTVRVLEEAGTSASGLHSKHIDEFGGQTFDYVITVCDDAAEQCPLFPGPVSRIHWSIPDPAAVGGSEAERIAAFRAARDTIRERVQAFREST